MFRIVLAASLLASVPALAQVAPANYREALVPAGKTPVKMYVPLNHDRCAVGHQHRQTGKLPLAGVRTTPKSCDTVVVAAADGTERKD